MPKLVTFKNLVLGFVISSVMGGCTGQTDFFSGSTQIPVAPRDSKIIDDARIGTFAPNIQYQDNPQRSAKVISFAFDGTLNDEHRVPAGERPTIVSYIAGRIPGTNYYAGVGMQGKSINYSDAALGYSMISTAEAAKNRFFVQADEFLMAQPNAEIRVFVTGFSRGAASARHFMNVVDEEWKRRASLKDKKSKPILRFYALLYDTVSTSLYSHVELGAPKSVNYLLHFVAMDEPRGLFPVDIDAPTYRESMDDFSPARINTVYLPGSHSDIGASYLHGVGDSYRLLTDLVLSRLGLIPDTCFENQKDSALDGKHDSRGIFDRLLQTAGAGETPETNRKQRKIPAQALTNGERIDIRNSLDRLAEANLNILTATHTEKLPNFGFTAIRNGQSLEVLSVSKELEASTSRLKTNRTGDVLFEYSFRIAPDLMSVVSIPKKVVRKIKNQGSSIHVTYLRTKTGLRLNYFTGGVFIDYVDTITTKHTKINDRVGCPKANTADNLKSSGNS